MKSHIQSLTLLASVLISTVCANVFAQGRAPSADRFFEYMDRNKDGNLDQDEVRRMPGNFRESLEKNGVSLERGISKEVFVREIPKVFEQMREQRERDEDRRRDDDGRRRDDDRRDDDRRSPSSNRPPAPKQVATYTPRQKVEITIEIPRRFEDGDTDGDGQIGLYEWRKWRPEERAHFKVYDKNGDGFLTPRELIKPPTSAELIAASSGTSAGSEGEASERSERGYSRDRTRRGPTREDSPRSTASSTSEATPAVVEEGDATTRTARLFFSQMDADKNKQITSEEWARSRRVKPKFEAAGIDLSAAMNEEQFIAAYKQAYAE